jgi:hypothetical protein
MNSTDSNSNNSFIHQITKGATTTSQKIYDAFNTFPKTTADIATKIKNNTIEAVDKLSNNQQPSSYITTPSTTQPTTTPTKFGGKHIHRKNRKSKCRMYKSKKPKSKKNKSNRNITRKSKKYKRK